MLSLDRRSVLLGIAGSLASNSLPGRCAYAQSYDDPDALYAALRDQSHLTLAIGGGVIEVVFADSAPGLDRERTIDWITRAATAVSTYFGRFPVDHVGLLVIAGNGEKVGPGTTYGYAGSAIRVDVGRDADEDALRGDWVLTHEMVHLALPNLPRRNLWLEEGNATYVEPIARAQAGQLGPEGVWRWLTEGMPKGQPEAGDLGLDHTPTWGRTYWGGAAFWLLADVSIYERTHGRQSLLTALRAVNRKSGGNAADWSADDVMGAGDAATGTDVLAGLYADMKANPTEVDLQGLFGKIGVSNAGGRILFDDRAPLTEFRRRLTQPPNKS